MNRVALTALLFCILALPLFSSADPVEEEVTKIRQLYNATEGAQLKTRILRIDDGPGSVEFIRYFDSDGRLLKMALTTGGDHGIATDYFYVDQGDIYFVFQTGGSWQFDLEGPEGSTIDRATERRVYFSDGKVIRHLLKTAESRDPKAVAGLLKKADNQSVSEPEEEDWLLKTGRALLSVDGEKALEEVVFGEG